MKTTLLCLAAIILSSAACSTRNPGPKPAQPDALWWAPDPSSPDRDMTRLALESAIRSGDNEVAAAAEYNQLHVVVAGENDAKANAALHALMTIGDDYTVAWLESLERRDNLSHRRERYAAMRATIHGRLQKSAVPASRQIEERFLRAGVARLCNPLELTLPAYTSRWAHERLNEPRVRSELLRFSQANHSEKTKMCPTDRIVRDLAANLAEGLPNWRPMFQ